jgi:uncharacterized protein (TIGR00730 family)
VCVFCGSAKGDDARYSEASVAFADALIENDLGLVYGGAQRGLMGVLADRVLARGGAVIGVMPEAMIDRELAHRGVTELLIVPDMHTRKAAMAARSDAFVALPGGFGTLDELCEAVTWAQLGLHDKPIGLYDVAGYFAAFRSFIDQMCNAGFVAERHRGLLQIADQPAALLRALGLHRYTHA